MANIGQPNLFIKLLANKYIILSAWIFMAVFYTFKYIGYGSINNYLIFKYTYFNASMGQNLYAAYPQYYGDTNHYGPIFCVIMAPFAVLKGCNLGYISLAGLQRGVPLYRHQAAAAEHLQKNIICIICTQELIFSLKNFKPMGPLPRC
jgi:hypothetical protein